MPAQGFGGGLGQPGDRDRVGDRACRFGLARHHPDKLRQLRAVRVGEAVHEETVWRTKRKVVVWIYISDRRALVPTGHHGVVGTVYLKPAVVSAAVVTGRRDNSQRAAVERDDGGRGVHIVDFAEAGIALDTARGIDLDGALAGDPAKYVEIVRRAVSEDAARTAG